MRSILFLALLLVPSSVFAEDEPPAKPPEAPSTAPSGERVTMPAKRGMIRGILAINLSKDVAGDPVSLSPDIWYGVNDDLTIGLVHSSVGLIGIVGIPGTSLCLTGDSCGHVYNSLGIDGRYTVSHSKQSAIAFEGGLIVTNVDPFQLTLKLGAVGRYRAGAKLAIDFSPNVLIGVTKREDVSGNNKETLIVPITAVYSASPKVGLMAQLGLLLPFADAADLYAIPFSLGFSYAVNKQLSIEAAFTLLALAGGNLQATGADGRSISFGGAYAF